VEETVFKRPSQSIWTLKDGNSAWKGGRELIKLSSNHDSRFNEFFFFSKQVGQANVWCLPAEKPEECQQKAWEQLKVDTLKSKTTIGAKKYC
jgi:hypothetical protein